MDVSVKIKAYLFLVISVLIKVLVTPFSVWGDDFIYIVRSIITPSPGYSLLSSPWIYLESLLYRIWLWFPVDHPELDGWLHYSMDFPFGFSTYLLAFILKVPILACDFLIALLIFKMVVDVKDRNIALVAASIWLINPYITLTAEMAGSNDLLIVLFSLLTLFFYQRRKGLLGSISNLIGIAFKFYTILILPVIYLFALKENKRRFIALISAASVIGAGLYFYWLTTIGLTVFGSFTFYSPITFMISEILLELRMYKIGLATAFSVVYCYMIYRFWGFEEGSLLNANLGFLLIFFAFFNWWPPYLMMLVPFLTIDHVLNRRRFYMIILLTCAFLFELSAFGFSYDYSFFYLRGLRPWMLEAASNLKIYASSLHAKIVFEPLLRSIYAALSITYSAQLLWENSTTLKNKLVSLIRSRP